MSTCQGADCRGGDHREPLGLHAPPLWLQAIEWLHNISDTICPSLLVPDLYFLMSFSCGQCLLVIRWALSLPVWTVSSPLSNRPWLNLFCQFTFFVGHCLSLLDIFLTVFVGHGLCLAVIVLICCSFFFAVVRCPSLLFVVLLCCSLSFSVVRCSFQVFIVLLCCSFIFSVVHCPSLLCIVRLCC